MFHARDKQLSHHLRLVSERGLLFQQRDSGSTRPLRGSCFSGNRTVANADRTGRAIPRSSAEAKTCFSAPANHCHALAPRDVPGSGSILSIWGLDCEEGASVLRDNG